MITVVGSINMDLVIRTERFPVQGETVLGDLYTAVPGGKGANQAVAAARLGNRVQMIGAVGTDVFGEELLRNLEAEAVETSSVTQIEGVSGIANILLTEGDNRIIVVPGANHQLHSDTADRLRDVLKISKVVILQLEMPISLVRRVLEICREEDVPAILNPAPATAEAKSFLHLASFITPNETEAATLFGEQWEQALEEYPDRLIVTLGKNGACFHDGQKRIDVEGFKADAIDTTGAGDAFNGALAAALTEGMDLQEAIRFSNAAASLAVGKLGAQNGMPNRAEVEKQLKRQ